MWLPDGSRVLCTLTGTSARTELAGVFAEHAAGAPTPAEGAEALAAWANAQGGRDNVTVVLIRITR